MHKLKKYKMKMKGSPKSELGRFLTMNKKTGLQLLKYGKKKEGSC